jgi:endonuclease/exonuclease/phosphatase family metal-dependent hydrolase
MVNQNKKDRKMFNDIVKNHSTASRVNHVLFAALCLLLFSCKDTKTGTESSSVAIRLPKSATVPHQTDTFTFAFYNVENLFDTRFEDTEYPEYNPAVSNWDANMAQKKSSMIANVIAAMHPDIIGLCEVESYQSLKQLRKNLRIKGIDYKYSVIGDQPVKTSTCTALLSKYPVKKTIMHEVRMDNGKTSRTIIEADVLFRNSTFKLFVNHWPSKMNPDQDRIVAAQVLKKRLDTIGISSECIIAGDFNINYDDYRNKDKPEINNLQKNGLNHILGTITDLSGKTRPVTEHDMILQTKGYYDLWLELPETDRMSEVHKGYNQTLDHIIIDKMFFDNKGISYIDNSYKVFTWNGKLLRGNVPFRWEFNRQNKGKQHTGNGYSDHLPVMASFTCKPFTDKSELYTEDTSESTLSGNDSTDVSGADHSLTNQHWVLCTDAAMLTEKYDKDRTFTHIGYRSGNRNISLARKSMTITVPAVILRLRGSGRISIRVRQRFSDWIYFNAPGMNKSMKSAHYENITLDTWTVFRLNLPENYKNSIVDMEIRAGKECDFSFDIQ